MRPWKKWWNQSKTGSQPRGSQLSLTEQTDWVIDYPACRFSCFYLADFGKRAWVGVLQIQFTWSEGWKRSSKGPIRSPEILKGKYFASVELDQQAWWSFLLILTVLNKFFRILWSIIPPQLCITTISCSGSTIWFSENVFCTNPNIL